MIYKRVWFFLFFVSVVFSASLQAEVRRLHYSPPRGALEMYSDSSVTSFPLSYEPAGYALSRDDATLLILNPKTNQLEVYDPASGLLIASIPVYAKPNDIAVSRRTSYIYVATGRGVDIIEPGSWKTIASRNFGEPCNVIVVDDLSGEIYAALVDTKKIVAMDGTTLKILNTSAFLDLPSVELAVSPESSTIFINDSRVVTALDSRTLKFKDFLSLEGLPESIHVNARIVFVELSNENSMALYDAQSLELINWYSYPGSEKGRWFSGSKGDLFFVQNESQIVSAEDLKSRERQKTENISIPPDLPASSEFILSSASGAKDFPSLDFDSTGNFSATWTDLAGNDGNGEGVYAREFQANGDPQANEFQANDESNGNQGNSSLGSASNGDYVIVWRDDNGLDGNQFGVFFRRFSNGGAAKDSTDKKATNTTDGNQREPSIDVQPDGDFVIAWEGPKNGGGKGAFVRRFSANGSPKENEQLVDGSSAIYAPDVATNSSGRYVVVWRDGSDDQVRARVYNGGSPVTNVFKVSNGPNHQFAPSVAIAQSGDFVVTWQENAAGGIQARLFQADGTPKSGVKKVSVIGDKDYSPSISMAPDGRFSIAWRDDALVVWARSFASDGTPLVDEFKPSQSGGNQLAANCAVDENGNFVVSWKFRPGNGGGSIRGRRFDGGSSSNLTVSCTATPQSGAPPLPVDFTADATGGNGNYTYQWDFGDGNTSNTRNPSHTYNSSGNFDAVVTVTSGPDTATCTKTIHVQQSGSLSVQSLSKSNGNRPSNDVRLSIIGSGFQDGATVSFNDSGIDVFKVRFKNNGKLRIRMNINDTAFLGLHDVTVTNPDGNSATGVALFTVQQNGSYPKPDITNIQPASMKAGSSGTLTIDGGEFVNDTQALTANFGQGINVESIEWISPSQIKTHISLVDDAICGVRDVVVANGGAASDPCAGCFDVTANRLSIAEVIPNSLPAGSTNATVTIKGAKFDASTDARIKGTDKISQTVVDCGTLQLTINIPADAKRGFHKVSAKNPPSERAGKRKAFEVTN
jgi:hypothetical protein